MQQFLVGLLVVVGAGCVSLLFYMVREIFRYASAYNRVQHFGKTVWVCKEARFRLFCETSVILELVLVPLSRSAVDFVPGQTFPCVISEWHPDHELLASVPPRAGEHFKLMPQRLRCCLALNLEKEGHAEGALLRLSRVDPLGSQIDMNI